MTPAAPIWGVFSGCFLVATGDSPEEAFQHAIEDTRRAIRTDPDLGEGALEELLVSAVLVRLHVMTTDDMRAREIAREIFRMPEAA